MNGNFVAKLSHGKFNMLPPGHVIEQANTTNIVQKGTGGLLIQPHQWDQCSACGSLSSHVGWFLEHWLQGEPDIDQTSSSVNFFGQTRISWSANGTWLLRHLQNWNKPLSTMWTFSCNHFWGCGKIRYIKSWWEICIDKFVAKQSREVLKYEITPLPNSYGTLSRTVKSKLSAHLSQFVLQIESIPLHTPSIYDGMISFQKLTPLLLNICGDIQIICKRKSCVILVESHFSSLIFTFRSYDCKRRSAIGMLSHPSVPCNQ